MAERFPQRNLSNLGQRGIAGRSNASASQMMPTEFTRVLPMTGIHNFRDYGGYAVAGGRRVVTGKLYRSAQHLEATADDLARVAVLNLSTVTDLRGLRERQAAPCPRPASFSAEIISTDAETASVAPHLEAMQGVDDAKAMYQRMLMVYDDIAFRPALNALITRYFAALAAHNGASLIHCLAGKDRTGLAVALLHHLLGVHRDDMMADYLLTNTVGDIEARIAAGARSVSSATRRQISDAAMRVIMSVRPEYLDHALAAITARHGSIDTYLHDAHAIDAAKADAIRHNFLV